MRTIRSLRTSFVMLTIALLPFAGSAIAADTDIPDDVKVRGLGWTPCALSVDCMNTYATTTTQTCTQAFITQISVTGNNTATCTNQAQSIASD